MLATAIREEKEIKGIQISKEVKLSLLADGLILYSENPKDATKRLLVLINEYRAFQVTLMTENLPAIREMQKLGALFLSQEDPLEKEMANHSSILAWRIPWTEKPGSLQSIGSQIVRHDEAT